MLCLSVTANVYRMCIFICFFLLLLFLRLFFLPFFCAFQKGGGTFCDEAHRQPGNMLAFFFFTAVSFIFPEQFCTYIKLACIRYCKYFVCCLC